MEEARVRETAIDVILRDWWKAKNLTGRGYGNFPKAMVIS